MTTTDQLIVPPGAPPSWTLRPYQAEAVDALYDGDPSVDAPGRWSPDEKQRRAEVLPTGTGKTRVIGEVVRRERAAGRSVGLLGHRDFLLDQMSTACRLALPGERIGRIGNGQHVDGFGVTAIMTPTLARADRQRRTRTGRTSRGERVPCRIHHSISHMTQVKVAWETTSATR